jgi:hypothetical protein
MSRAEYQQLIARTVEEAEANGDVRYRNDGATAYWSNGVIVIHNPNSGDQGTAFSPANGKQYFDTNFPPAPINPP